MAILAGLVDWANHVIDVLGYPGIFVLMAFESMVVPVPAEAVMPFAGFLVATHRFPSVWLVTLIGTLGTMAGSGFSYWIGAKWGDAFVRRWGKYVLITHHDWRLTQGFFQRTGGWSILIARFVPVVRHLISLPAGATRMRLLPFLAATFVGGFAYNGILAYLGFKLGENYDTIRTRLEPFDLAIAALLALAVVAYVALHVRRLRKERGTPVPVEADASDEP